MPTAPTYDDLPARLRTLLAQASAAFLRHAARPAVRGPEAAAYAAWTAAYAAQAALAEHNPAFAQGLLPGAAGADADAPNAWPLLPAGVRAAVDADGPGTVTLTVDVGGPVAVSVRPPAPAPSFAAAVTTGATRATATFAAVGDGVYTLQLSAAGQRLATLYVVVARALWGRLREHARAHRYAFRAAPVAPSDAFTELLGRLVAADAAAATGQPLLAAGLLASAAALPAPAAPTALFPARPCPL